MLSSELLTSCCRAEPDLEFEGLLKRQHTRVKYFQGSLMNAMDLERAKVTGVDPISRRMLKSHSHYKGQIHCKCIIIKSILSRYVHSVCTGYFSALSTCYMRLLYEWT